MTRILALSRRAPTSGLQVASREGLGLGLLFLQLVLVPILFRRDMLEAFELPKVLLLRLFAILLAALALSDWVATGGYSSARWRERLKVALRDPLCLGIVLFLGSAVSSTVFSMSPRTSLLGGQQNNAGLGTVSPTPSSFSPPAVSVLPFATVGSCSWRYSAQQASRRVMASFRSPGRIHSPGTIFRRLETILAHSLLWAMRICSVLTW